MTVLVVKMAGNLEPLKQHCVCVCACAYIQAMLVSHLRGCSTFFCILCMQMFQNGLSLPALHAANEGVDVLPSLLFRASLCRTTA